MSTNREIFHFPEIFDTPTKDDYNKLVGELNRLVQILRFESGITAKFQTQDGKTVTVENGIVTNVN